MLGEPGKGYKIAIETLNEGRIGIGAQMLGLARRRMGTRGARRRRSGSSSASRWRSFRRCSSNWREMATEIEAARLMVYNAARLKDAGLDL